MLTEVPARLYGVADRGRLAEGYWADVVVFDPARVGPGPCAPATTSRAAPAASTPTPRGSSTSWSTGPRW